MSDKEETDSQKNEEDSGEDARDLVVTISDEGLERIQTIVEELKERGVGIDHVFEISGTVMGKYAGDPEELNKVSGVLAAEASETKSAS